MRRVQRKVQFGFTVALIFLFLTGAAAWLTARRDFSTFEAVDRSYRVMDEFERILVETLNLETGTRGYAITGDEACLQTYRIGAIATPELLAAAKQLTADNPDQQRRLALLEPILEKEVAFTTKVINLRRSGKVTEAFDLIASGEGMRTMGEIHRLVDEMERQEEQLLTRRISDAEVLSQITTGILAFCTALALGTVGLARFMLRADFEKRLRAEEALRRSEESLNVTLQSIGDAVLATDTEGRVTRLNPVAEALTGWTQSEALGKPVSDVFQIVTEEKREPVLLVEKVLATGRIHGLVNHTVLIARDKKEFPIADSAAPMRDRDGKTVGVVLVFRDVSDERQAEQRLHEKEEDLIAVLKASPEAIGVINLRTGLFEKVNSKAEQFFGLAAEDLVKVGPVEMSPEFQPDGSRSSEAAQARIDAAVNGDYPVYEWTYRNAQGDLIPCEVRLVGMPSPRAHLVRFSITDISERKRAEEEIRSFNKGLEELVQQRTAQTRQALATLDAMEEGAFIFDPDTLLHSYVNEGAVRQLGYSRQEMLGMTPVQFQPEFDETRFRALLAPLMDGETRTHRFSTLHRHKSGHEFPVEINLQYITPAGERPRFIAIVRDISERQKHERLALRSQRLEAIGTLAGGIAHDLNNVLAPILMGVEVLRMRYSGESQILDIFQNSATRGADMVRQLLAFAKGAEGERVSLQLHRVVKEIQNLIKASFPKNIELVVKSDPDLPLILGDPTQLHQVLLNLCVNARDAMPQGGVLILATRAVEMDEAHTTSIPDAKPGSYVLLQVRDTGTGIPSDIIDRIFEPFFTTKDTTKGTGLGLSTVMGIVKGHGGFLQVRSEPGKGSTFDIYLPAGMPQTDTKYLPKPIAELRGHGETILLVDDEAAVREMARAVLRRLNFNPLTATDGLDGLMQSAEHRTELRAVITDLHMPHMDGLGFIRAVRRVLPDIPIAVVSGRMDDATSAELKSLGVAHHLDKPFTETDLAELLVSLLHTKKNAPSEKSTPSGRDTVVPDAVR